MKTGYEHSQMDVAVVGMAGRFPGAKTIREFWQNLQAGADSIAFFTDEELLAEGQQPAVLADPDYVRAGTVIEGIEGFDAAFFGMDVETATRLEPQHRLLLELVYEALAQTGMPLEAADRQRLQAFVCSDADTYRYTVWGDDLQSAEVEAGVLTALLARTLLLPESSIDVQNDGGTALEAVHRACEALQNGSCRVALAGAASLSVPQKTGYFALAGGGYSADGHCRAFDAQATGTVPGNGGGVVVLKRLTNALEDGDTVYAVIKGSAIHHGDQRSAIAEALQRSECDPRTIRYVEAHGCATPEEDAAEIAALTSAFALGDDGVTDRCAIGTVQANIGHLGVAAGMAGLIKTILALKHDLMPPMLHLTEPHRSIDFANSPFFVNTSAGQWPKGEEPRRAGVQSAGLDGSYAHVVLEEAPIVTSAASSRPTQLLLISAKTDSALEAYTEQLQADLQEGRERSLADMAYTLHVGRDVHDHRRMLVCRDSADAVAALAGDVKQRVYSGVCSGDELDVVFLFPGLGSHYVGMGGELYVTEPIFREHVDHCCELLQPLLGLDLRDALYPDGPQLVVEQGIDLRKLLRGARGGGPEDVAAKRLNRTELAHTSLFVIEYALSQLLIAWGVRPQALLGHSLGEYVAACLAGVFSLEDALTLVARRAQMIETLPGGAMLAVSLSAAELQPHLGESLYLAIVNSPTDCLVSGTEVAIEQLQQKLKELYVPHHRLEASHGFHSPMLDAIAEEFAQLVGSFARQAPRIPILSNVTGTWMTPEQAVNPAYWAQHLCQTVRFADGLQELSHNPNAFLLEVGPGNTLSSFVQQAARAEDQARTVLATMRHSSDQRSDTAYLQTALGRMWLLGASLDGTAYYAQERRMRVPLPTHVFERQRFWR